MSDARSHRTLRVVALALAGTAVVLALIAVFVVVERAPASSSVESHTVKATDLVALGSGVSPDLRVVDAARASRLGLAAGDVIVALSGRTLATTTDYDKALRDISLMKATTIFVDIKRNGQPRLLRLEVEGALFDARVDALAAQAIAPDAPPAPDPLLDTIRRIDDTHYTLPRATLDALMDDPTIMAKSGRIVPSVRSGKPDGDGMKLYAIRPHSVLARLGFSNGDTVHAINGFALASPDAALEAYVSCATRPR